MSTFQEQLGELSGLMTEHLNQTMGHMPKNGQVVADRMRTLAVGLEQQYNALADRVQMLEQELQAASGDAGEPT